MRHMHVEVTSCRGGSQLAIVAPMTFLLATHLHLPVQTGNNMAPHFAKVVRAESGRSKHAHYRVRLMANAADFHQRDSHVTVRQCRVANPGPLGLYAFGYTTALLQVGHFAVTVGPSGCPGPKTTF